MVDLAFFVMILLLVIIVFGVILQSIVNPETELKWDILNAVFYYPYFQMYGEIFLEDGLFKTGIVLQVFVTLLSVQIFYLIFLLERFCTLQIPNCMHVFTQPTLFEREFCILDHCWLPNTPPLPIIIHVVIILNIVGFSIRKKCDENFWLCYNRV